MIRIRDVIVGVALCAFAVLLLVGGASQEQGWEYTTREIAVGAALIIGLSGAVITKLGFQGLVWGAIVGAVWFVGITVAATVCIPVVVVVGTIDGYFTLWEAVNYLAPVGVFLLFAWAAIILYVRLQSKLQILIGFMILAVFALNEWIGWPTNPTETAQFLLIALLGWFFEGAHSRELRLDLAAFGILGTSMLAYVDWPVSFKEGYEIFVIVFMALSLAILDELAGFLSILERAED